MIKPKNTHASFSNIALLPADLADKLAKLGAWNPDRIRLCRLHVLLAMGADTLFQLVLKICFLPIIVKTRHLLALLGDNEVPVPNGVAVVVRYWSVLRSSRYFKGKLLKYTGTFSINLFLGKSGVVTVEKYI